MNTPLPETVPIVADPKRPWKAIAGAVVAFLGLLWANLQAADSLNSVMDWLSVIVPTILTFAAVFGVTNPKVARLP